jgi:hypothetical protein
MQASDFGSLNYLAIIKRLLRKHTHHCHRHYSKGGFESRRGKDWWPSLIFDEVMVALALRLCHVGQGVPRPARRIELLVRSEVGALGAWWWKEDIGTFRMFDLERYCSLLKVWRIGD